MAQNTRITVAAGDDWVQLTDASTTGDISIMLAAPYPVMLQATATDTAPTSGTLGPLALLQFGDGWSEATILEKFPGVATAAFLWARRLHADSNAPDAIIGISHG